MAKLTFISTRVPVEVKQKLETLAKRQDKSLSKLIRRLLEKAVE